MPYPKRLIEVDLPIKRISAHARREKSIRHGHISTLHIWWARRPLAACRAVICAALWPDPADPLCPEVFRTNARQLMEKWASDHLKLCGEESGRHFVAIQKDPNLLKDNSILRRALLDFIADFANWDNSTVKEYLDTSRALTQSAHEALGGAPDTKPLVVDPFAGGGSIPLESLRVGADAFASDLNPVAVLLNKVILEYIPKYGQRLADEVRKWGEWIKQEAEKELAKFYPKDPDGATPIAYLWARTIRCEGPGCGAEVPLMGSRWLAKKTNRSVALQLIPHPRSKRVDFKIIVKQRGEWVNQDNPKQKIETPIFDGTVKRGSATCPCCGYTIPVARVREQLKRRRGGAHDARLLAVVTSTLNQKGRDYRLPSEADMQAIKGVAEAVKSQINRSSILLPDALSPIGGGSGAARAFSQRYYGMDSWADFFSPRQALALGVISAAVRKLSTKHEFKNGEGLGTAVQVLLALVLDRIAVRCTANCIWDATTLCIMQLFNQGQAIPMRWEFAEMVPLSEEGSGWSTSIDYTIKVIEENSILLGNGTAIGQMQLHYHFQTTRLARL